MGRKVFWLIIALSTFCFGFTRFGTITEITGNVSISRNTDFFTPSQASMTYLGDTIITGTDGRLTINTMTQRLGIKEDQKILLTEKLVPKTGLTIENYSPETPTKSVLTALGLSALFPGLGHWYINDKIKSVPLVIGGTYLASNAIVLNPGMSYTERDNIYNQKQQFAQMYLALWIWSLIDVYAETTNHNNKVMENLSE